MALTKLGFAAVVVLTIGAAAVENVTEPAPTTAAPTTVAPTPALQLAPVLNGASASSGTLFCNSTYYTPGLFKVLDVTLGYFCICNETLNCKGGCDRTHHCSPGYRYGCRPEWRYYFCRNMAATPIPPTTAAPKLANTQGERKTNVEVKLSNYEKSDLVRQLENVRDHLFS